MSPCSRSIMPCPSARGSSGTWLNRGLLLLQMNRDREALDSFEHALALRPGNKRIITAIAYAKKKIAASAAGGE